MESECSTLLFSSARARFDEEEVETLGRTSSTTPTARPFPSDRQQVKYNEREEIRIHYTTSGKKKKEIEMYVHIIGQQCTHRGDMLGTLGLRWGRK